MVEQRKAGADDLGWKFHIYHATWAAATVCLFALLPFWLAILVFCFIGLFCVWYF